MPLLLVTFSTVLTMAVSRSAMRGKDLRSQGDGSGANGVVSSLSEEELSVEEYAGVAMFCGAAP